MPAGHVVLFADESVLIYDVKLFAGRQLFSADQTCEAFEVKHFVAGATDQIGREDALRTARTLGPE